MNGSHRVAYAGVFIVTLLGLASVGAVLPVLPHYVTGPLGGNNIAVGVVIGCYAVTGIACRPIAGRFADRIGRRLIVVIGIVFTALAGVLYWVSGSIAVVIAARLAHGIGEGTVFTAGSAWVVDLVEPKRRARLIGIYGLSIWAGLSIGPAIGEALQHAYGFTAVWQFATFAPLVALLIAIRIPDPFSRRARPAAEEPNEPEPKPKHPLIAREALGPGLALAMASIGYATIASFVIFHLDERGIGHGGGAFTLFAATVVLTRLVAGGLPERIGPLRCATGAAFIEAIGLVLIAVATSLPVAFAGVLAMGAAFSLLYPALSLIVVERVPDDRRGAAFGTFTACFDLGVGLGGPIAGIAATLSGFEASFLVAATIALVSATMLGARAIALRSRQQQQHPSRA